MFEAIVLNICYITVVAFVAFITTDYLMNDKL